MIDIFAKTKQLCDARSGEILKTLSDPAQADMANRYFISKLLVMLGVRDLAAKTSASAEKNGPQIDCVNPGWCKTKLFPRSRIWIQIGANLDRQDWRRRESNTYTRFVGGQCDPWQVSERM